MWYRQIRVTGGAIVIDQIHYGIIDSLSGKGTRLTLVIAAERKGFVTSNGVVQPVIDTSFEMLIW